MKKVIVSGVTGMDGSHMADYLLKNTDHEIYGLVRYSTKLPDENISHLKNNPRVKFLIWDMLDIHTIEKIIKDIQPDYFINFAAQSHVHMSWEQPIYTWNANSTAVLNILETIRKFCPTCRFYQASSSEMFGDVKYSPQDEAHPFRPRSVYAAAKCAAHHLVKVYRESYKIYAVGGILFNHESERRREDFVTRKITTGIAKIFHAIKNGEGFEPIRLGSLDAKRDWSYAPDMIDGVWKMLNQEIPNDYVLASGETHTVREFVEKAFSAAGFEFYWDGVGANEKLYITGLDLEAQTNYKWSANYEKVQAVVIDPQFYRPNEVNLLLGNPEKVKKELGWNPSVKFEGLISRMVKNDIQKYAENKR